MPFDTYFSNSVGTPLTDSSQDAQNYSVTTSFSNGSLTFALKDKNGNDPTQPSPVVVRFPDLYGIRDSIANKALSLTVPSGVALGTTSGEDFFLYLYAVDNNGVLDLAVTCNNIYGPSITSNLHVSTVQMDALVDSRLLLYANSTYTNISARLIGRFSSNQVTAALWQSTLTETRLLPTQLPSGPLDVIYPTGNTVDGGTFISGAYRTRTLNTTVNTLNGLFAYDGLSTNTISLGAGIYKISSCALAFNVGVHKSKFQVLGLSSNATVSGGGVTADCNMIEDILTLSAAATLTLVHYCASTQNGNGFGPANSFGDQEVYTNILIEKIR